jgi:hypothetical protein
VEGSDRGTTTIRYLYIHVSVHPNMATVQASKVGRDSSVGIATRYGLDGPGIESRWGRDFQHLSTPALGPTGVKRPGRGVDHPPSSSAEVKERVELYLCSPSGSSWPVIGRTLLASKLEAQWRHEKS